MLMKKFDIDEEQRVVSGIVELGSNPDDLEAAVSASADGDDFDPFELLLSAASEAETSAPVETARDETLFTDKEYLSAALQFFNENRPRGERPVQNAVREFATTSGLVIALTDDMKRRLRALIPVEAMPDGDYLQLSDDKKFIMSEMARSMQNNLETTAWPTTQYLWRLHPLFSWVNDKATLLFNRGEAPVLVSDKLAKGASLFIIVGSIPNKKSTPLVDEWFGVLCQGNKIALETLTMRDVLARTNLKEAIINTGALTQEQISMTSALLPEVIDHARAHMRMSCEEYRKRMTPLIDEELEKLIALREKRKNYQLSLFDNNSQSIQGDKNAIESENDKLFERFEAWVRDTLIIQDKDNPYIRVIAVILGAQS